MLLTVAQSPAAPRAMVASGPQGIVGLLSLLLTMQALSAAAFRGICAEMDVLLAPCSFSFLLFPSPPSSFIRLLMFPFPHILTHTTGSYCPVGVQLQAIIPDNQLFATSGTATSARLYSG